MNHPPRASAWVIRAFRAEDEPGITDLFRIVFGRLVPHAYWEWKLRTLPAASEYEWVAECDGRIVGHYAVTPIRFKLRDRQVLIPHGSDAMTHPQYRRQGILTALGRRANEVWARAGSPFQIGFQFGGWGSVRELLGWRPVVRLSWMKRWISPFSGLARQCHLPGAKIWREADSLIQGFLERTERKARGHSGKGQTRVEQVRQADGRFDRLWSDLGAEYDILAIRDRAWVQWRCLDTPGTDQRLFLAMRGSDPRGYLALRIARTTTAVRATILDCLVDRHDTVTAHALLNHAIHVAVESGARSIAALVDPESFLADQLRTAGFHPARHGYDLSIISYSDLMPSLMGAGWFLTGAEGDVL